jgi:hypothetical protein
MVGEPMSSQSGLSVWKDLIKSFEVSSRPERISKTNSSRAARRVLVEASILLASSRGNPTSILKEAAAAYKVDTEAITLKVKQEFATKEKAKKAVQSTAKTAKKAA